MGIDTNSLPFILDAKNAAADFSRTLTIGRQNDYRLSPQLVELELRRTRMPATAEEIEIFLFPASVRRWVVPPTQLETVVSIDDLPDVGATVVHDTNTPIPDPLEKVIAAGPQEWLRSAMFPAPLAFPKLVPAGLNGSFWEGAALQSRSQIVGGVVAAGAGRQ